MRFALAALFAASVWAQTQTDWISQIKNKPSFYVISGASTARPKCDGVTDDYISIQAVINAAEAAVTGSSGVAVVFPPGVCKSLSPLVVNSSNVRLTGCGPKCSVIYQPTLNTDAVRFTPASGVNTHNQFDNIQILGNAASTSGYAVNAVEQTYFRVQDMYILGVANGIRLNNTLPFSGFIDRIVNTDVETVNTGSGVVIGGSATNGVFIDGLTVNSASGSCRAGVLITSSGNTTLANSNLFSCNSGLELAPANGEVAAATDIVATTFDHAASYGILSNPAAGGTVYHVSCTRCDLTSSGITGYHVASTGQTVGVRLDNSRISYNAQYGVNLLAGSSVEITGGVCANNGSACLLTASGVATVKLNDVTIGNTFDGDGGGTQAYGWFMTGAVPTASTIIGNTFTGNTTASIAFPGGSNYAGMLITNNQGLDDQSATVASAGSFNLPASGVPNIVVTGTTALQAIFGGFQGRTYLFRFTDAAPGGMITGGNIYVAKTVAQNQALQCTWDGTGWTCLGP